MVKSEQRKGRGQRAAPLPVPAVAKMIVASADSSECKMRDVNASAASAASDRKRNLQLAQLIKKSISTHPIEAELLAQLEVGEQRLEAAAAAARKSNSLSSSANHSDNELVEEEAIGAIGNVNLAAGGQPVKADDRQLSAPAAATSAETLKDAEGTATSGTPTDKRNFNHHPTQQASPSDGQTSELANRKRRQQEPEPSGSAAEYKMQLVWKNIIAFVVLHSCIPLTIYMVYTQRCYKTLAFSVFGMYLSGLGVTGGAHRLWSHRSYKAKWPVQLALMCWQTMAGQNSIYTWCRDHRLHHKFAETDADPHNIRRGFFFAHMGWLCCRKHPDVKTKGKLIDMSDLEANSWVMFQHRHFWWLAIVFMIVIPVSIPCYFWAENFWTSFVIAFMLRYLVLLHGTWLVNSAAHYTGWRPYDRNIDARESPYAIFSGLGEGFHNYHHTFPFDYATSEFGRFWNLTTAFIDLCAVLGLVRDRRTADEETILRRKMRTGELSADAVLADD